MTASALDELSAINVVGRYFQYCDAKDFDGTRSLWTDTVTVNYGGLFPLEGQVDADTLKEVMSQVIGAIPVTQHMVTSLVADIDGDTAQVRFHLEALHHHPRLGDWTLYARNVIGLRRTADGWKISSEHLSVVHQTGNTDFVSDLKGLMGARGAATTEGGLSDAMEGATIT